MNIVEAFSALSLDEQRETLKHLEAVHDLAQSKINTPKFIALARREIARHEMRLARKT